MTPVNKNKINADTPGPARHAQHPLPCEMQKNRLCPAPVMTEQIPERNGTGQKSHALHTRQRLIYRDPDGQDDYDDEHFAIRFNRPAIMDINGRHRPVHTEDGTNGYRITPATASRGTNGKNR